MWQKFFLLILQVWMGPHRSKISRIISSVEFSGIPPEDSKKVIKKAPVSKVKS